ncbi:MAG: hypothetical protein Q4P30_02570 [Eubacteriales bacterium]|nr:hypothetical protein [Eubacteriales bacterium]
MNDKMKTTEAIAETMARMLSGFEYGDAFYKILIPQVPDAVYIWRSADVRGRYLQIMPGDLQLALFLQEMHTDDVGEYALINNLTTAYRGIVLAGEEIRIFKEVAGLPATEWTATDVGFLTDLAGILASTKTMPSADEMTVADGVTGREYTVARPVFPVPETNIMIADPTVIRLLDNLSPGNGFLEVDLNTGYVETAGDGTSYCPLIVTIIEPASGAILMMEAPSVSAYVTTLVNGLVGVLKHAGRLDGIYYIKEEVRRITGHIAQLAGVPLVKRSTLPVTDAVMTKFRAENV